MRSSRLVLAFAGVGCLLPGQQQALARLDARLAVPACTGIDAAGEHRALPAPGEGEPRGLAFCRGNLWLLRDRSLLRVDPATGAELAATPADELVDLAADARFLYGVAADGTMHVLDPLAGRDMLALAPAARTSEATIHGITVLQDRLLLADGCGRVFGLDQPRQQARWLWGCTSQTPPRWLADDGTGLVLASGGLLQWLDADTGEVLRLVTGLGEFAAGASHDGELWLLRTGHGPDCFYILRPYPELSSTRVQLIGVGGPGVGAPGAPPGEILHWQVGRRRFDTAAALAPYLRELAAKPRRTRTATGALVTTPFVLEIHPGVTVADVLGTLEAAALAGIELRCPGLAAWAAAQAGSPR